MLHASETWSLTKPDLQHLQRNDRAMISQICNVKPEDVATIRSNKLLAQLEIAGLPRVREKSGKLKFFQGQGIVREFWKLSGKFGNTVKCQGIVREFSKFKI